MRKMLATIMLLPLALLPCRAQTNVIFGYMADLQLSPTAGTAVTMSLISPNPKLVNGIWVSPQPVTTYTDANGFYSFRNVSWGEYEWDIAGQALVGYVGINTTGSNNVIQLTTNTYAFVVNGQAYSAAAGPGVTISTNGSTLTFSSSTNYDPAGAAAAIGTTTPANLTNANNQFTGTFNATGGNVVTNGNYPSTPAISLTNPINGRIALMSPREVTFSSTNNSALASLYLDSGAGWFGSLNLHAAGGDIQLSAYDGHETISGIMSANSFSGSGTGLTNIDASQVARVITNAVQVTGSNVLVIAVTNNGVITYTVSTTNAAASSGGVTNGGNFFGQNYPAYTNILAWYDPASYVSSATNGQGLASVQDITGNGWTLGNALPTNVIWQANSLNGKPAFYFNANWISGTAPTYGVCLTNFLFQPQYSNNFCVIMVLKDTLEHGGPNDSFAKSGYYPEIFNLGTNLYANAFAPWNTPNNSTFGGFFSAPLNFSFPLQANHTPYVFMWRMTPTNGGNCTMDFWLNGVQIIDPAWRGSTKLPGYYSPLFTVGCGFYNTYAAPNYSGYQGLVGDIICATNVGNAEAYNLLSLEMTKYNIGGQPVNLHLIGDSIWNSEYAGNGSNILQYLSNRLPNVMGDDEGMPGGTSTQIFSYESNWNNGQIAPRSAKTVDGYLWGYNDGPNGISLTQFIQDTTNGIAWSHAQGHLAFICTLTSAARETNTYGGNCTRSNMNVAIYGLLTNLPPTCPDALVTLDRDPNMGPYGSYSNQTYFVNTSLDGNSQIHPTGLGYQLMCDRWIIPAINYLNGQQGGGYASYQGGTNYVFCHITNGVPSWNNNP